MKQHHNQCRWQHWSHFCFLYGLGYQCEESRWWATGAASHPPTRVGIRDTADQLMNKIWKFWILSHLHGWKTLWQVPVTLLLLNERLVVVCNQPTYVAITLKSIHLETNIVHGWVTFTMLASQCTYHQRSTQSQWGYPVELHILSRPHDTRRKLVHFNRPCD